MPDPVPIGNRFRTFDDLAGASDETLRQLAARVHIVDLAYAFYSADEGLRDRLLNSVRPRLAAEIQSAINTVKHEAERYPQNDQIRSAQARVLQIVHESLGDGNG